MSTLSDKYIAGFLDADGSIGLQYHREGNKPSMVINFSQKTSQDKVISLIHEKCGGSISYRIIKDVSYTILSISSSNATKLLNRIKKFLVIKRHYAECCLRIVNSKVYNIEESKKYLKEQRKELSLPVPKFPPRQWLAGYFDGDGCLSTGFINKYGHARLVAVIASSNFDTEGIETICKNFGGTIFPYRDTVKQWRLDLVPSKAIKFLGYFAKHLIAKKEQADFILGCAAMGHYRDGNAIKAALKQLKTHQHRLNGLEVSNRLIVDIKDMPVVWNKEGLYECVNCHSDKNKHVGFGLCSVCYFEKYGREYHKQYSQTHIRKPKRQSEDYTVSGAA